MRMLYRVPGPHLLDGVKCDWLIVPDTANAIAEAEGNGWRRSPALALEATQEPPLIDPPRKSERDELTDLAESLGIKVDGRWSIARIRAEIDRKDGDE